MSQKRRSYTAQFKFKIVLEAARGEKTISQIDSHYNVQPPQVGQSKRQLQEAGPSVFSATQALDDWTPPEAYEGREAAS